MMIITKEDAQTATQVLLIALIIWSIYGWKHSEDQLVPAINVFWLGAINFMIMAYMLFSK